MTFKRVTSHPFEAIHTIHLLLLLSLSFHLTLSLDIPYSSLLSPPYENPLSISSSSACFQATSFRISFGLDQLQSIHPQFLVLAAPNNTYPIDINRCQLTPMIPWPDLKSLDRKVMWVRSPLRAPQFHETFRQLLAAARLHKLGLLISPTGGTG